MSNLTQSIRAPRTSRTGALLLRLGRYLSARLAMSVLTLWILSLLVFAGGQLLPGDVGRAILGPFADAGAVAALNHKLGVDRPVLVQYLGWLQGLLRGDMGVSHVYRAPVAPFIGHAIVNSLKLAALSFFMVVPLSIFGGVVAALHAGRWPDRIVTIMGVSLTVIPEFVSAIMLILVFSIGLNLFPVDAVFPAGASFGTQLYHLFLPALPLTLVLFGYLAKMARAGTIAALSADFTRTAVLKGLPHGQVLRRHVLPNALLPTITVAMTQLGYMIGGLVVIETLFQYQGIGSLIHGAARTKDFPMLEAGVMVTGAGFTLATLIADLAHSVLDPRVRTGGNA
ncbi:binding-protein-dependent transport system inner membrane protein [Pandoraea iniqua]|uniref:Binding-protein-dependent transport system inner membrane protein n=1 Tax=Pandoraea iniqua TaxID=2508288 RepID=A0A5E4VU40_9BURK|nr:ABC transporter permease [Pandoraea iniqua]VVE15483.1 binding-protein-dependent transport system inner membrane protein [Pandoraea iniqua]